MMSVSLRVLVFAVMAVMVMTFPAYAMTEDKAVIGEVAPAFTLNDIDGNVRALSDFRGKTVVLEWTNHECPYVVKHYSTGNMQSLQEEMTAAGDVVWLSIASSAPGQQGYTTPEEAKMIVEKEGARATARLLDPDGEVGRLYGARTTPHMYVINADGVLIYKGAIDDNPSPRPETVKTARNLVVPAVMAAREGRMPDVTQSNPYGCSVKYSVF